MTTAAEVLGQALLELAEQGRATPCQGRRRDRWTSESAEDRAWAASVCVTLGCPVIEVCGAAADEHDERFGVWAGVDRTPAPHKKPESNHREERPCRRESRGGAESERESTKPRADKARGG